MVSVLQGPFLTEIDSRAQIKGSRDPLGVQPLWTRFGRYVVGNLTTVSSSLRDFTTLLLGYYFVDEVARDMDPGSELAVFLKWEQLAAYSRYLVNQDAAFRGTERVQKWSQEREAITLSADQDCQILSNQKTYGLWGLYTMPGRSSGLVDAAEPKLTLRGREFVEQFYLPMLAEGAGKDGRRIRELLKQPRRSLPRNDRLISSVAHVLKQGLLTKEREFYRFHLVEGGPQDETAGRQRRLAGFLAATAAENELTWSPQVVSALARDAQRGEAQQDGLAVRLERIRTCDSVLAPTTRLFSYLLGLHDQPTAAVEATLRTRWGNGVATVNVQAFSELRSDLGDVETADRWISIATALAGGRYAELIALLIQQNSAVMSARGGGPWIERRNDRLQVRFRDELGELPKMEELGGLWRFSYFLDALRNITVAVEATSRG
jgi:hypothetical protein